MPGIESDLPEPQLRLGQILRSGLRPVPLHTINSWRLDDGRLVAVLGVQPVVNAPCMTSSGAVYERVSGATVPITDPAVLARLFDRGEQAQQSAMAGAEEAALKILAHEFFRPPRVVCVGIGLCALAYPPDIGARLFTRAFEEELADQVEQHLALERMDGATSATTSVIQTSVRAARGQYGRQWVCSANWNGSVGVVAALDESEALFAPTADWIVLPAWTVANEVVARLRGYDSIRLTLAVVNWKRDTLQLRTNDDLPQLHAPNTPIPLFSDLPGLTVIRRIVEARPPTSNDLGSMQRELQRAAGIKSWEMPTT